ncbi:Phospho-2-dehydro-3-deoxyheptonate aldolase [Actinomyces slackii]|uniref:Phospho-2-dehydro-3-deoxyheptonate aldolase n=1 Tax=Actinomyces slackii TaxID=52774 RepID=A0A3S4SV04_9ACTO|nr:3-deoxy-7-phosphoheptulonate synthase class II [Actinomyces slackii]VEG75771.1 Phospho-2-dehydro-3-deoxyheptonate aldolase [Actinomyces slackii]
MVDNKRAEYPSFWRELPAAQQPIYPDTDALKAVLTDLRSRPPLVFGGEVDSLRKCMAEAGRGRSFVLMGGDCAESFYDSVESIRRKVQTILQMAAVLTYGASMPVVKIGRIAGQYAKPRSIDVETRDGVSLPVYRGDSINGYDFTSEARTPDPSRMLEAYLRAGTTLNIIRAFTTGGYADLRRVHSWNQGFTSNPAYMRFEDFADEIDRAMRFMEAAGVDFDTLRQVHLYASHEALQLEYEDSMVRNDFLSGQRYCASGHLLWIGERTRSPEHAHVSFLSSVVNPVAVKIGPATSPLEVSSLIERLNPAGDPGRLTFITRMGSNRIRDVLPRLIEAASVDGRPVTWIADPMHGNTIVSRGNYKTRRFDAIIDEVRGFFEVHKALGTIPGGIHIELTGNDVTEVLGGGAQIGEANLSERYETLVDPRLNHEQSLEMAFEVAEMLRNE